jgi:tRNA-splicing ligase RtcB
VNDHGAWRGKWPASVEAAWMGLEPGYKRLGEDKVRVGRVVPINQIGTLGSGNHFIEVCLDEKDRVWIMLHSGSRGVGNAIGTYFIEKAKEEMTKWFVSLPDMNLAYLPEGSEHFTRYIEAVGWAQEYARVNREIMMDTMLQTMEKSLHRKISTGDVVVSCHHNYVAMERHFGENVIVTRKGAVSARRDQLGIIPGSMGTKSYIVRGKGNADSFCSCSHGAGRRMSRTEAKNTFSVKDHELATEGVECRKDRDVVDETPAAYKDIDAVMEAQRELVDIVYTLKQIVCVKG